MFEKDKYHTHENSHQLNSLDMTPEKMRELEMETKDFLNELDTKTEQEETPSMFNFSTVSALVISIMGALVLLGGVFGSVNLIPMTVLFSIISGSLFLGKVLKSPHKKRRQQKQTQSQQQKDQNQQFVYDHKSGTYTANPNSASTLKPKIKKFGTSKTNKRIFGLAGGISNYFNTDASLIRALMVISIFVTQGAAIPIYIIAAAFLGKEEEEKF